MKSIYKKYLNPVIKDKPVLLAILAVFVLSLIFVAYFSFKIKPTDLQVPIRYSSFGSTFFYSGSWWNHVTIIVFGLIFTILHTTLAIKIYVDKNRTLAIFFSIFSVIVICASAVLLHRILASSAGL